MILVPTVEGFIENEKAQFYLHWLHQNSGPECEGAALESLFRSCNKTRDVVLSQDIPLLMTKANGKPRGETRRSRWEEGYLWALKSLKNHWIQFPKEKALKDDMA